MLSSIGAAACMPATKPDMATRAEHRGEKLDARTERFNEKFNARIEQAQMNGKDRIAAHISKHADNFNAHMDRISTRIDNIARVGAEKSQGEIALARFETAENRATELGHTKAASVYAEARNAIQDWLDNPTQIVKAGVTGIGDALISAAEQAGEDFAALAAQAAENGHTHRGEHIEARGTMVQRRLENLAAHFAPPPSEEPSETISLDIVV